MICPDCEGRRYSIADHVSYADGTHGYGVAMACTRCKETGEVPDEMAQWIEEGRKMRNERVFGGNYRNLAREADRRGISVVELSQMEMGKIKPIPG